MTTKTYGKPIPNDWTPDLGYTRFTGCAPNSPEWRAFVRGAILGLGEKWDATTGDAEAAASTGFEIYESLDMDCDEYSPIDHDHPDYAPAQHNHDHGSLTGLADDDHPQYHTDARADARYSQLSHNHAHNNLTGLTTGDPHPQYLTPDRGDVRYYGSFNDNRFEFCQISSTQGQFNIIGNSWQPISFNQDYVLGDVAHRNGQWFIEIDKDGTYLVSVRVLSIPGGGVSCWRNLEATRNGNGLFLVSSPENPAYVTLFGSAIVQLSKYDFIGARIFFGNSRTDHQVNVTNYGGSLSAIRLIP